MFAYNLFYSFSDDCQNWKLLPEPETEHLSLSECCKSPFQGDPGLVVEVVDDAPIEEEVSDDFSEKDTNEPDKRDNENTFESTEEETMQSQSKPSLISHQPSADINKTGAVSVY